MKYALYLMTKKGYEVLKTLIHNNLQDKISEVIVGFDKNIDNDFSTEITNLCLINNIPVFLRSDNFNITAPYSISVSWRWLIPTSKSKLIVLHDSLLPKYRGFAPLVNMLINKENKIGVTAIFASKEYDKGPIICQSHTKIEYPIKISEAIDLITKNYSELVLKILNSDKPIKAVPQNEALATYSLWRDEEDYAINWKSDSESILRHINAVSTPYKGATTYLEEKKIRILDAQIVKDVFIENRDVGKLIFKTEKFPVIVCQKGLLMLTKVVDDETGENLLPFKNFRLRFKSKK